MSKLFTGSICLTDISENFKKKHSGFSKSEKNGKIYANVSIWINDQPDQFGNDGSIQINPKKDSQDSKFYIGNVKLSEVKNSQVGITDSDINPTVDNDDLPF